MTQLIFLLISVLIAYFTAKAAARKNVADFKKSGINLQSTCWAVSRLLGCIIISAFVIAFTIHGRHTLAAFCLAILAAGLGHFVGAKKDNSDDN